MSMKHKRPLVLLAFVQAMGVCAMALCLAALVVLGMDIMPALVQTPPDQLANGVLVVALIAGVGLCLLWLLAEFVCMCGRVRKETAFTAANVRALGRIALAFFIGGGLLLPLGKPLMDWLLLGMRGFRSPIWWLLPAFVAWAAALLVRAIAVLMKRAVAMQTESDLTV